MSHECNLKKEMIVGARLLGHRATTGTRSCREANPAVLKRQKLEELFSTHLFVCGSEVLGPSSQDAKEPRARQIFKRAEGNQQGENWPGGIQANKRAPSIYDGAQQPGRQRMTGRALSSQEGA